MDPIPLAIYIDGVAFRTPSAGRQDSCLGIWIINLITSHRVLVSITRSSDACQCGCRGWCSLFPHLLCTRWQIDALVSGSRPRCLYDGRPWPSDSKFKSGRTYNAKFCLLWVKGDWAEHSKSLGLSNWASWNNPCMYCHLNSEELHSLYDDLSDNDGPGWPLRSASDYFNGVKRCEVHVPISSVSERSELDALLVWSPPQRPGVKKTTKPIGGRVVVEEKTLTSGIKLFPGDRLEPSSTLCDIGSLSAVRVPTVITLWRVHYDEKGRVTDAMSHNCPFFDVAIGTSPAQSIVVDALHALYFGPVMRFVTSALWRSILYNTWKLPGPLTQTIVLGARQVSSELLFWQQEQGIPHNDRIRSISVPMLGPRKGCTTKERDFCSCLASLCCGV